MSSWWRGFGYGFVTGLLAAWVVLLASGCGSPPPWEPPSILVDRLEAQAHLLCESQTEMTTESCGTIFLASMRILMHELRRCHQEHIPGCG